MSRSSNITNPLSPLERRAVSTLAGVYGLRMFGLFLLLPVLALYAEGLPGATPLLAGLALGIYGLTQATLQIPFGLLSDRIGRKPVILGGLALFCVGSVVAALAHDIYWIILGRALQGSGAIAAAVMALAADLTREEQRTKAMAIIGMTIGSSFLLALIVGPSLAEWGGISGLFWLTACLTLLAIAVVALLVPSPSYIGAHLDAGSVPSMFGDVLRRLDLLRLDVGIFTLHLGLTSVFLVVPLGLRDAGLAPIHHTWLYLGVMLGAIAGMIPLVVLAERGGRLREVFLGAIGALIVAQLALAQVMGQLWFMAAALLLYFVAFNLLEALLPSLVSKTAPAAAKGTAMGVYSTSQFAGAFFGGLIGGWVHGRFGLAAVLLLGAGFTFLWLLFALGMSPPRRLLSKLVNVGQCDDAEASDLGRRMAALAGVQEAVVVGHEGVAYLKIDPGQLDQQALDAFRVEQK